MTSIAGYEEGLVSGIRRDATVNIEDAKQFAELADRWWDESGPFWPLHTLNRVRLHYLADRLPRLVSGTPAQPLAGMQCLDIGCGGGLLAEGIARLGATVTGIDVVERNINIARHHAAVKTMDIEYITATAEDVLRTGRRFDLVLNLEVVEHVDDFPRFMSQCCQLVKPGGHMAVATINRSVAAFVAAIVGAEYLLRWLPKGTHRWREFRRPDELRACLGAGGLQIWDRCGIRVNPLTRRFSISRSEQINYMLLAKNISPDFRSTTPKRSHSNEA